jgi:hypothetical protein
MKYVVLLPALFFFSVPLCLCGEKKEATSAPICALIPAFFAAM